MTDKQNLAQVFESFSPRRQEIFLLMWLLITTYLPSEVILVMETLLVEAHRAHAKEIKRKS